MSSGPKSIPCSARPPNREADGAQLSPRRVARMARMGYPILMARKRSDTPPASRPRSPGVPLRAIRKLAREIAEKFRPERIILFGSHAYGTPHADSDVDLLVIMP